MQIRRFVLIVVLLFSVCLNLLALPASAQDAAATAQPPRLANYGVRCQDGQCKLIIDTSLIEAEVPVPAREPIRFELPTGNLGFLSGAAVEIADQLTLKLPIGDIQIRAGDLEVGLDTSGNIQRLHGKADSLLPSLTLPNNLHIGGRFGAEFGYDYGANLGAVSQLLDAEAQYFYLRLGEGFSLDTAVVDENGKRTPITISVPDNESATIIVDPSNQVLYLDGRFNLSQVLRLAVVGGMMGVDVGQLPMLSGLALPLRSTIGVAALFSRQPDRNFVELNTDLGIDGGPVARLLQLGDMPLLLDSTIRIDRSGMLLQGVADAKLAPDTLLESGGVVELFVPFQRLSDAYVRIGGDLSVPILGITAGNEAMLGGGQGNEATASNNADELAGPSWWDEAATWIGSAASNTASSVASGAQSGVTAMQGAVDAALSSARSAAERGAPAAAAGSALSGAASGVACGVNKAQQLWCQTTGLCEPPEDVCPPEEAGN